jgi:hypothetical protein
VKSCFPYTQCQCLRSLVIVLPGLPNSSHCGLLWILFRRVASWSARRQLYIESFSHHCLHLSTSLLSVGSTSILFSALASHIPLSPRPASLQSLAVSLLNEIRFYFYTTCKRHLAYHKIVARRLKLVLHGTRLSRTRLRPQRDPTNNATDITSLPINKLEQRSNVPL